MRLYVWFWLKTWKHSIYYFSSKSFYSCSVNKLNSTFSAFFFISPPGSAEGGFSSRTVQPLQPDWPLPGTSEGLRRRGPRRRQGTGSPRVQPHLHLGGRHGTLQKDAGAHVGPAGCCRKPSEKGKPLRGGDFCWWRRLELKTKIESAWPCDRETKTPPVRLLRKDLISHMRSNLFAFAFLNQNSQPDTTVEAERLRMFTAGIDNNYCNLIGFLFCKQSLCRNALENWIYWNDYQLLHGVGTKWIKEQLAHLFIYGVASCSTAYCIISQTNVDIIHLEEVHELPIDKCHMISNHYRRETHRTVFPVLPDSYKVCVSKMLNGC